MWGSTMKRPMWLKTRQFRVVYMLDLICICAAIFLLVRSHDVGRSILTMEREFKESLGRGAISLPIDVSEPNQHEFSLKGLSGVFTDYYEVSLRISKVGLTEEIARNLASGLRGDLNILDSNGALIDSARFKESSLMAYSRIGKKLVLVKKSGTVFPDQCTIHVEIENGAPRLSQLSCALAIERDVDYAFLSKPNSMRIVMFSMAILASLISSGVCLHLTFSLLRRRKENKGSCI